MLEYNEQVARKRDAPPSRILSANAHDGGGGGLPPQLSGSTTPDHSRPSAERKLQPVKAVKGEPKQPVENRSKDVGTGKEHHNSLRECDNEAADTKGVCRDEAKAVSLSSQDGVKRVEEALEETRKDKVSQVASNFCFLLRNLYTGGGLDAQQQGWESLPMNLINTLTLQLGAVTKVGCTRVIRPSFALRVPIDYTPHY